MNSIPASVPATPIVKWVGGKRQLQSRILDVFSRISLNADSHYYEPFFGGGAIYFALQPKRATVSDVNRGLLNLYEEVKRDVEGVIGQIVRVENHYNSLSESDQRAFYLETRVAYNTQPREGVDQAVNFLILNKAGFNGLYRENAKGAFNVPFGQRKSLALGQVENLQNVSRTLQSTAIRLTGYRESVSGAEEGDFVYFDPPYVPLSVTSAFTAYSADGFGAEDQEALAQTFRDLDRRGVHVALSNSGAPAVRELYGGFRITDLLATRAISASARGRASVVELLVTNF